MNCEWLIYLSLVSELIILQLLVDDIGEATITNDGATILKMLEVEHPAAHFSLLDLLSIVLCGCVCLLWFFIPSPIPRGCFFLL